MAISAFIVKVPSAEPLAGPLRERFDATSALGVPAHITVLIPFMDPRDITPDVLQRAQQALDRTAAFSFRLSSVGRFPAVAYLAPEPAAPFIALTQALAGTFADYPPYAGAHAGIVPHLTVAHGTDAEADEAALALQAALDKDGPVTAHCGSVSLIENSSGRWNELHVFHLPQG